MIDNSSVCRDCPRECNSSRTDNDPGMCGAREGFTHFRVAKIMFHKWEEPFISGTNGSAAVFFAGCQLGCLFCQNYKISSPNSVFGKKISPDDLLSELLPLIKQGVHNINLVSGSHYTRAIIDLIKLIREKGITSPVIWNSSLYEKSESIKSLEGFVDIYLPDFKFVDSSISTRLSNAPDYFKYASSALAEMIRQKPMPVFSEDGLLLSGVVIRHLVLPGYYRDSIRVIDKLAATVPLNTPISIMSQYTPVQELIETKLKFEKQLQRRLTTYEYNKVIEHAIDRGFSHVLGQERSSATAIYTPDFSNFNQN